MIVKLDYCGTYECDIAYKGPDYVRLALNDGTIVASFEGVVNFSVFTFYDDSDNVIDPVWTDVPDIDECSFVVMKPDGTTSKSKYKCKDVPPTFSVQVRLPSDESYWMYEEENNFRMCYLLLPGFGVPADEYETRIVGALEGYPGLLGIGTSWIEDDFGVQEPGLVVAFLANSTEVFDYSFTISITPVLSATNAEDIGYFADMASIS